MRKHFFVIWTLLVLLLAAAALPAWAAGQEQTKPPVKSQVYVRDGILYAVYHPFDKPVKVVIPAAAPVEGQMVIHRNHRATFRRISAGDEYTFDFGGKNCSEYALLIAHFPKGAQISYHIGAASGVLKVPPTAGPLKINWPVLTITRVGNFAYSIAGSLKTVKISDDIKDGAHVESFRYWPTEGELLEGDLVLSFSVPPSEQRPEPGETISFTFPFCSGCVSGWLAGFPVSTSPPSGPGPGSGGFDRFWPALPAATAPVVFGWALSRRVVDVWLEREAGRILVRRGRRGPGRVRAVLNFAGAGEGARRELVLARGEAQEVQVPEGWQVAELATPGRRNKGTPTRLERGVGPGV